MILGTSGGSLEIVAGALAAVVQSGEEKVSAEELDFRLASRL